MTTVVKININDLSNQFFNELKEKFGKTAQVEIRVEGNQNIQGLLSDKEFWSVIDMLDWNKKNDNEILAPAVAFLSKMHIANIYLFKDFLSEKLYLLDTKKHAHAYLGKEKNAYFSADDFLYTRCAVISEGKVFFQKILQTPSKMPSDVTFEAILDLADEAYFLKTGKKMEYVPSFNYETKSNKEAWLV